MSCAFICSGLVTNCGDMGWVDGVQKVSETWLSDCVQSVIVNDVKVSWQHVMPCTWQGAAPCNSTGLSVDTVGGIFTKNGSGGHGGQQAEHDSAVHPSGHEGQQFAGLHDQMWGQWVKGSNYSSLLGIHVAASSSSFGDPTMWKTVIMSNKSSTGPQRWLGCTTGGQGDGFCSTCRSEGVGGS